MAEKIIRTAIAGSGYAAKFHYEALLRLHSVRPEITGSYSPTVERLKQFTGQRKLKAFKNIEELIDNADVVHVCTPPSTHEPIVIAALEKNRHVIVEKPFTGYFGDGTNSFNGDTFPREKGLDRTLESIRRMIDAEKKSKGKIMYDESWFTGYQHEMEAFYRTVAFDDPVEIDSRLAADVIATIYAGYLSAERKGAEVPVTLI